jgi:hypothetical protein
MLYAATQMYRYVYEVTGQLISSSKKLHEKQFSMLTFWQLLDTKAQLM